MPDRVIMQVIWFVLSLFAVAACGGALSGGEVEAVLDADDICANPSLRIATDGGVQVWETDDRRPAVWSGEVVGSFAWFGDDGTFTGPRGVTLEYRRLGEGEFSELRCLIG